MRFTRGSLSLRTKRVLRPTTRPNRHRSSSRITTSLKKAKPAAQAWSLETHVADLRSGRARMNKGQVEDEGMHISASLLSQSIDRKVAYARAFARVLALNGVAASIWNRAD